MPIRVECPQCGRSFYVPDERAGQTGRCSCGTQIVVPRPAQGPPPAGPPPGFAPPPQAPPGLQPLGGGPGPEAPGGFAAGTPAPQATARCTVCGMAVAPGNTMCVRCAAARATADYKQPVNRPGGITFLVILNYFLAACFLIGAIAGLAGGRILSGMMSSRSGTGFPSSPGFGSTPGFGQPVGMAGAAGASALMGMMTAVAAALFVLAIVYIVLSYYLWKGANWARIGWIVVYSILGIVAVAQLAGAHGGFGSGSIWRLLYIGGALGTLFRQDAKDFCSQ